MKHTLTAALAASMMLGLAPLAHADMDANGEVGLPLNPTAQIPMVGGMRVQGDYFKLNGGAKTYGLHVAGRVGTNWELSGGLARLGSTGVGALDKTGVDLNAKYLISRESDPVGVKLAVGAGYSDSQFKNIHIFGVATKSLGALTPNVAPVTGHLGLRWDRFNASRLNAAFAPPFFSNSSMASIYAGLEVPFTKTGELGMVAEIASKNIKFKSAGGNLNGSSPYAIGLRYRPSNSGFGVTVGAARSSMSSLGAAAAGTSASAKLFVQLGYTFNTSVLSGK